MEPEIAKKTDVSASPVEVCQRPEELEEEAVTRSTRTEKSSDGGKMTTTTTVTTHKSRDGPHLVTKQLRQITRVGGIGMTQVPLTKCSAEEIAERLARMFEQKALVGTAGTILVRTENWNSQDGITHRGEKSQAWEGAPRLTSQSFNEADFITTQGQNGVGVHRSTSEVKQNMIKWCQINLKDYKHVNVTNLSTSWNDGMAFCALIHHFLPDSFDYNKLDPKNKRENFQLAFDTAEKRAGIVPLLDVNDMATILKPDYKCIMLYIQSILQKFIHSKENLAK